MHNQPSAKRVLTVIPCLNEEANLESLVLELVTQRTSLPMHIVIVDGGSKDGTLRVATELAARFPNVSAIKNPRTVQAAAVNRAVATFGAGMEYLIRVDAHSDYPENYCETLIEEAESTRAAAVVVAMRTAGRGWFQLAVAAAQNSRLGNGGSAHRMLGKHGEWTEHGHHALMRIDAFLGVGGYDESFPHNEDAELDARLVKAGNKIWLTGKTWLTYYPRSSPVSLFRQYVNYGAGRAKTLLKHRARPKIRQLAPSAILPFALLAILSPLSWPLAVPLGVWAFGCIAYGIGIGIKKRTSSAMAAGVPAMIMHLAWSIGFWKSLLRRLPRQD